VSETRLIITFPSQVNLFLLTALTIVQACLFFLHTACKALKVSLAGRKKSHVYMSYCQYCKQKQKVCLFFICSLFLFSQYGCTELPTRSYVSDLPAIEPVGEFFNMKNAVLAGNAAEVGTLFSDSLFAGSQNVFLQKYELGSKFVDSFNFIFRNYLFESMNSKQNFKYDLDGEFMICRGHTEFQGKLIRDIMDIEPVHESIKKLTGIDDKTFIIPSVINIYTIWEADNIGWKILFLEINGINMFELLQ